MTQWNLTVEISHLQDGEAVGVVVDGLVKRGPAEVVPSVDVKARIN